MKKLGYVMVVALVAVAGCKKVEKVELSPKEVLLTSRGQTATLAVRALDGKGQPMEGKKVEFSSADAAVAAVDAQGGLTANKSGATTVTAKVGDKTDTAAVEVRIPAKIELDKTELAISGLGNSVELKAKVLDEIGRPIPGAQPNYTVDVAGIAGVANGIVTAMGVGESTITVSFGPIAEIAKLKVTLPEFDKVVLEPATVNLKVGENALLTASVKDTAGAPVAGVPIAFTTSDEKIATVDAGAKVVAVAPGKATVTAKAGEKTATVNVVVKK